MKKIMYLLMLIILIGFNLKTVYALKIEDGDITIGINTNYNLSVSGNNGSLTWTSTNGSVATVSSGLVTGKTAGTTYISVTDGSNIDTCKVTVSTSYVAVTGIKTTRSSDTISVGKTVNIGASVTPSNASNKKIRYVSSNTGIVRVDSNGNITGVNTGSAYITLVAEAKSITYNVTVNANTSTNTVKLTGISLNSTYELMEGATGKLTVTYSPTNATNKGVTWKSSNTSIVTVDASGNLKGVSPGTATITATSKDGSHVATSKVTVNALDKTLKGIALNKKELTLDPGKSETLTVTFTPNNAENKEVTWRSTNSNIATVDNGKVTAVKPGTVEIKVTSSSGDFTASCKVTVTSPPVESVAFPEEKYTIYVGDSKTLEVVTTPEDSAITNARWTSTDEAVATVNEYGEVTAVSLGTTTITVTDKSGKITASTNVEVTTRPPEKLIITIEGYDINFDESVTTYTLKIKDEKTLNITTNIDSSKVTIAGNRELQNGSIITVTIKNNNNKKTYIFNIRKKVDYSLYFIVIISIILLINIMRVVIKNKKNS